MKPFYAKLRKDVEVPVEMDNEDHRQYWGIQDYFIEEHVLEGVVTDILELKDVSRMYDETVVGSGVYAVFWIEKGDEYIASVQDISSIFMDGQTLRNYVNGHYSK